VPFLTDHAVTLVPRKMPEGPVLYRPRCSGCTYGRRLRWTDRSEAEAKALAHLRAKGAGR
jgi:hypothetical protein